MNTKRISITVPVELHHDLRHQAYLSGKSINALIIDRLSQRSQKKQLKIQPFSLGLKHKFRREEIYEEREAINPLK